MMVAVQLAIGAVVGAVTSWIHGRLLARAVDGLATRAATLTFVLVALIRIAVTAGALVGTLWLGPWALVAAIAWFAVVRTLALRKAIRGGQP